MTAHSVLSVAVSVYGVPGALASLLQLRRLRRLGSARDVSLLYLSVVGGYLLWLGYGIALDNMPLVLVDSVGELAVAVTICFALRIRRGLRCLRRKPSGPAAEAARRRDEAADTGRVPSRCQRRLTERSAGGQGTGITNVISGARCV